MDRLVHLGDPRAVVLRRRDATGQVRCPRTVAVVRPLDDDDVAAHLALRSMPACFRMRRPVPIGNVLDGLPVTVTLLGFVACVTCRWLPLVLVRRQPFSSIKMIISLTLSGMSTP